MSNIVNLQSLTPEPKTHSFVDTIHGLTDKLHQLRHDDKSKSGNFFLLFYKMYNMAIFNCLVYNFSNIC